MACQCKSNFSIKEKSKLYISFNVDYLFSKVESILGEMGYYPQKHNSYLELITEHFEDFIRVLLTYNFTKMELENINILALDINEQLNFGAFAKTRTLKKWSKVFVSVDLLKVIDNNELSIHFQPIVNLKNHRIFGYECLTRASKEDGTDISPIEIFEFARENDMIFKLDSQTRKNAINTASEKNITDKIFINFVPTSIYNPENCLRETVKLIKELNISPEQIIFEVVETEKVENLSHLKKIMDYYRSKGFMTALDDVASGYSSLNTFVYLKPDYIKIDQEVIRNIDKDEAKQAVFNALVNIAGETGTKVLAEGIETKYELDFISKSNIDYAQGYYFSKPASEPALSLSF